MEHTKTLREKSLDWFNSKSSLEKTQICDTHTELIGSVRRWKSLTGREIQEIYEAENPCAPNPMGEKALSNYIRLEHNQDECEGFSDGYEECQKNTQPIIDSQLEWERALVSLTPSGSEFCGDSKACVNFVRDLHESRHKMLCEQIIENKNLKSVNEELSDNNSQLLEALKDATKTMEQVRGLLNTSVFEPIIENAELLLTKINK